MDIPVYAVTGFLDAGKTDFINGILQDGFARQDKTLLICCEEGDEEYDVHALKNVEVVMLDDEEQFTRDALRELEKKHRPKQILIEYNGMWPFEKLNELPANWILYQIMNFVYGPSFDVMARNMGQLMMEKIKNADLLVFNRCTPEVAAALRKRNLRMVNRRAEMYLEYEDGRSEDYVNEDVCPFDVTQDPILIPDEDFGVWYVDAMDHPEHYNGKRVHMKAIMCHSKKYPGTFVPGRFAMVCCANDTQFLGVVARGDALAGYKNRDWIEFTATCKKEYFEAYQGEGPILYIEDVKPCEKPQQEVVTF
jgi:G3E family GTPase